MAFTRCRLSLAILHKGATTTILNPQKRIYFRPRIRKMETLPPRIIILRNFCKNRTHIISSHSPNAARSEEAKLLYLTLYKMSIKYTRTHIHTYQRN